jgi:hypothetical protein
MFPRLPTPEHPERGTMPFEKRLGLDNHKRFPPIEEATQSEHCQARGLRDATGSYGALFEERKLLAEK